MSNILALGGAGFIGSYIVRDLLEAGHHVTAVDNFSKYGRLQHDFFSHPNLTLKVKDVRTLYPADFKGYDYILCLAALIGGTKYFHRLPYQIARDNTEIISHAIDCTLGAAPEAIFIYFSSSMIYERVQRPVTEEDALQQPVPITNYGMQKLFGEFLTRGAHEEFGLTYLIVRPFNAVGGGELPHVGDDGHVEFGFAHVIPDLIYKTMERQSPLEILGDGSQVRTFTHAKDIARALRLMIERGLWNEDLNLCGNNTYSVRDLAQLIWAKVNPEDVFPGFKHLPAPPTDVPFRIGVSTKAEKLIQWTPQYEIDYIIDDSLAFIRQHMRNGVR